MTFRTPAILFTHWVSRHGNRQANLLQFCLALSLAIALGGCSALGGKLPPRQQAQDQTGTQQTETTQGSAQAAGRPMAGKQPTQQTQALSNFEQECQRRIQQSDKFFLKTEDGKKTNHVKVGATGYGAPPKNYYPEGQRRLMTIRAAKIDAYRALAEIVGGLHVWGGTAIADMVLERDRYRVFIDTYVRGARVVSVAPMPDDTYKTVVEMHVDHRFLSQVMAFIDPLLAQCLKGKEQDNFAFYGSNGVAPSFYYSE